MAFFTEATLRSAANDYLYKSYRFAKSADSLLREAASTYEKTFDVFLSHSLNDADLILGAYRILSERGLRVYVDWIVDRELDRSKVTSDTAEKLRERMRQSQSLVYVHSARSGDSKWMPWELGFFDGYRSSVAIWPIIEREGQGFAGQEYLGLYPWIDGYGANFWVNRGSAPTRLYRGPQRYKPFVEWLAEQRRAA